VGEGARLGAGDDFYEGKLDIIAMPPPVGYRNRCLLDPVLFINEEVCWTRLRRQLRDGQMRSVIKFRGNVQLNAFVLSFRRLCVLQQMRINFVAGSVFIPENYLCLVRSEHTEKWTCWVSKPCHVVTH